MAHAAIRPARVSDVADIARVHVAAWRRAFTFLPEAFLRAFTDELSQRKWAVDVADLDSSMFVATTDSVVTGFLQVSAQNSEVMSLYVEPASWAHGVGSTLLAFGEQWLRDQGTEAAELWTARDSEQSRAFYERRSWIGTGEEQSQTLAPGVTLHEVKYRKPLG